MGDLTRDCKICEEEVGGWESPSPAESGEEPRVADDGAHLNMGKRITIV